MVEKKIYGKKVFIEAPEDFYAANVIFRVEFDYNYKAILLRTDHEADLYYTLRAFLSNIMRGDVCSDIKNCLELSTSLTVDIVFKYAPDAQNTAHEKQKAASFLRQVLARKIVELCTYAPYGYNLEVPHSCYTDGNIVHRLVESELLIKPDGQRKIDLISKYLDEERPSAYSKKATVYCYSIKDGRPVRSFESTAAAAKTMNCSRIAIVSACEGNSLTAGGFAWSRYEYEQLPAFINNEKWASERYSGKRTGCGKKCRKCDEHPKLGGRVYKFDAITGKLIEIYGSIQEAAMHEALLQAKVADACKAGTINPIVLHGKYIFTDRNLYQGYIMPISYEDIRNADKNGVVRRSCE